LSAIAGKKIAIVGGGPGGLTLARLLQQSGAQVSVYERDQSRSARVQGSALDLHERDSRGCIGVLAMGNKLAGYEYRAADEHTCVARSNSDGEVVGQSAGMVAFRFGRLLAARSFELCGKSASILAERGRAHEAVRILFLRSAPGIARLAGARIWSLVLICQRLTVLLPERTKIPWVA